MTEVPAWVREELGGPRLGDARRDARFLKLVGTVGARPAGRVSQVFPRLAERQGAYDFLEHGVVEAERVTRAMCNGTARRCRDVRELYLPLDGSSLSIIDNTGEKGLGSVGNRTKGGRGLKVISALAVSAEGVTQGVFSQVWWARGKKAPKKSKVRPLEERESFQWHQAVALAESVRNESARDTLLHFIIDREGDASKLMQRLMTGRNAFTVRANGTRKVLDAKGRRVSVRRALRRKAPCTSYLVDVPARCGQPARQARMTLRYASVRLVMRDRHSHQRETMALSVVWALEEGRLKEPLDWMLYTTSDVKDADEARAAVQRYTLRWRVEEFHRAWKQGACCVEDSQLRSKDALIKWATVHAVVAGRAERLKLASRATPDVSPSTEFAEHELEALRMLKEQQKKRTEVLPDAAQTLEQAVRWLADLGGYIGPRNGPPGTTVIARGLEYLEPAARMLKVLRDAGRLR